MPLDILPILDVHVVLVHFVPMQLRYINDQWDKDYREHQEVFRRFREDSHRAQSENESFIAVLKENKEQLLEQIRDLQYELDRSRKEVQRIQQQQLAGHQNGINPRRLKELEEENAFLRSQVGNVCVCGNVCNSHDMSSITQ